MSTISASTTSTTAYKVAADTTGTLVLQTGATPTTAVTIDTSQNVGIGTSSPAQKLNVSGSGSIYGLITNTGTGPSNLFFGAANAQTQIISRDATTGAVPTVFLQGTAESMRIDSSGNLLVGTTNRSNRLSVDASSGTTSVARFGNNTSSGNVSCIDTSLESNGNNTSSYHLRSVTQNVNIWYLYGNGTSSFTSDQRLKKNIENARSGYLDDLMQLRVVKYNWRNQDDDTPKELGLIAQEVEAVFPGLVQDADETFEDGITPKVLKGSVLPFMLLKAIQELKAELDAAKADIATLKGAA